MIAKLLIANRGEIACRIIRTARAMGIATVAVYSDADTKALHVRQADEAVHIGPSPAAESYLRGDRIIAAALETGAEAIHPGYGFLSENADFARAVIAAGLIWVGPRPESIEAMGLKDAAKKLMREAGVTVTPGYEGEDQSLTRLAAEADAIGYPVLIKAVAGGGGKGMRKVDVPANFAAALESCRREAKASFSNDEVLLEKWITSPRHIEVQVFGDAHGNVVHLFERDCSLQRRHQKVIEEAPAPGMDEATREAICAAAVRAAKAVDYEGAGTIEFIADALDGLRADRIFFMEMNTRLQVEHPVTEEITGVDLVEWQLRVASGEPVPLKQEELRINGHAIEARLYAEDPAKGFLPVTGRLDYFDLPTSVRPTKWLDPKSDRPQEWTSTGDIRIETGVAEDDFISPYYDPMVAKLICHGESRIEAVVGLTDLCANVLVYPVKTNAAFLHSLLINSDFVRAKLDTAFIEKHEDDLALDTYPIPRFALDTAAQALLPESVFPTGFRLNSNPAANVKFSVDGDVMEANIINPAPYDQQNHPRYETRGDRVLVTEMGTTYLVRLERNAGTGTHSAADGDILAPMPGKVIAVDVAQGDAVTAGQRLLVLEAMKMEHALTAPFDGVVAELSASEGAQVQVEAVLARVVQKGVETAGGEEVPA